MNLKEQLGLSNLNYGLLFDIRRSVRYHDRRRAFYEQLHQITSVFTVLMAGSVLFDLARPGNTPVWLMSIAVAAALLSTVDMVVGYSRRAVLHSSLRERFATLEISMVCGSSSDEAIWQTYQHQRLLIEKDEPSPYQVLDLLCRNELLRAEGFTPIKNPTLFYSGHWWKRLTCHVWLWNSVLDQMSIEVHEAG